MTSEIAILNRYGVALAADSAVTVEAPDGTKIYNTVNKLFAISRRAPVAIMFYGAAELTAVPWDTIVKVYRHELGTERYSTLREYGDQVIAFLDRSNGLFAEWQQEGELIGSFDSFCRWIVGEVDHQINEFLAANQSKITQAQIDGITSDVIDKSYQDWRKAKYLPGRTASYATAVRRKWSTEINRRIDKVFGNLTITARLRNQLRGIAGNLYAKDIFSGGTSGIVVAGFGESELFPSYVTYELEGVVLDRLKYRIVAENAIGNDAAAIVVPFAQREMVDLFIAGIDPFFRQQVESIVQGLLNGMPDLVIGQLGVGRGTERKVRRSITDVSQVVGQQFGAWLERYSQGQHVGPVIGSVSTLPKEELAAMAEALVNLTSFKRRVTHELETVGGPIDVAIVSKGDGLIWIKRKHYFDSALNPHFMAGYAE